jgi:galactose mutarotase-like enzyme
MRAASSLCGGLLAAVTVAAEARPAAYTGERVGRTVRLTDTDRQVVVSIAPFRGNVTFEMGVKGHGVLHFPLASIEDPRAGHFGIPFRGPWANRLGEPAFYANGRRYLSLEPMPVSIGFHPYFQLTDSPRDDWTIAVGARTQWLLAENKILELLGAPERILTALHHEERS